jgi:hypothetical protein
MMIRLHALITGVALIATAGPGLPADFPVDPNLPACKPIVTGPEVICDYHQVDGHAVFTFYMQALPKAGYKILDGAGEQSTPKEFGAIGFSKGGVQGAITITGTDASIQVLYPTTK